MSCQNGVEEIGLIRVDALERLLLLVVFFFASLAEPARAHAFTTAAVPSCSTLRLESETPRQSENAYPAFFASQDQTNIGFLASANPVNNTDPSGHETLPSLMTGFTIQAIGLRSLVGGAVGVWDANFRGYSAWECLAYGAVGGAIGPLIPWQLGMTLTGYGIGEALLDGDYDSALFRGAAAVVGAGSFRWAKSLPGGRLGNLNTQLQNSRLAIYLNGKGWTIRNGEGMAREERIPPSGGGRNGETWVDITAEKNGTTLRIQTVGTLANGAPTPRELNAASRIRAAFPSDKVLLVPKSEQSASPLPLFLSPVNEDGR